MWRAAILLLLLWAGVVQASARAELEGRQAQAQQQQNQLRARINALQKEINQQESSHQDAASQLKASESAISDISSRLASLASQQEATRTRLQGLEQETHQQQQLLAQRQAELADLLRAQYASGLSPWTALLSGDDPQAIGRELTYLSYVSQSQADALRAVQSAFQKLQVLQAETQDHEADLASLLTEAETQKGHLEAQKQERAQVLSKITDTLREQHAQKQRFAQDDARLGKLLSGLEKAIVEQKQAEQRELERRKAEEARRREEARQQALAQQRRLEQQRQAAEAVRQEALQAQQQAEREQKALEAREARLQVEQARARVIEAEKAEQAAQAEARLRAQPATMVPPAALSGLGKNLPYPVRGQVQGRFGASRPDGGIWRGIVIRANEGTPVLAIAPGKVVFASWMNGFGNIMIVDHGEGYLSVYAYNQSLLRQVGDQVSAREPIAAVGSTGGQVEPGLYFEIRHQGKPVNPQMVLAGR